MKDLSLKYGLNPNQTEARIYMKNGEDLPLEILNGRPGYINMLDALNAWQLVKEVKEALGQPAATSFKHVSPTSVAIGKPLDDTLKKMYFVEDEENINDYPLALAYIRARGTDRMSSFGDFVALSDKCDVMTAKLLAREVSDGVIAPDYEAEALEILKEKKKGKYNVIKIDPNYDFHGLETKDVFGISFEQSHNDYKVDKKSLTENIVTKKKDLPDSAVEDLLIGLITLKYTQSNSVCYIYGGQVIGVGAGQQSRIHCVRLAAEKAELWILRHHKKVLNLPFKKDINRAVRDNVIEGYINKNEEDVCAEGIWEKYFTTRPEALTDIEKGDYISSINGVSLASDAFFPFDDSIIRAKKIGVSYVAEPGGSIRDDIVIDRCDDLDITMTFTGMRLFHH